MMIMLSRFDAIPGRYRRRDGQTDNIAISISSACRRAMKLQHIDRSVNNLPQDQRHISDVAM